MGVAQSLIPFIFTHVEHAYKKEDTLRGFYLSNPPMSHNCIIELQTKKGEARSECENLLEYKNLVVFLGQMTFIGNIPTQNLKNKKIGNS